MVIIPQTIVFLVITSIFFVRSNGFSVALIHRDSPKSPYYNSSSSSYERITASFERSVYRSHFFNSPRLVPYVGGGEYLVKATIGSPPFEILAVAVTGSDLVWTQCSPCSNCFKQDAQMFNPSRSVSYRALSCNANACRALKSPTCGKNICGYKIGYGDGSYSVGDLSTDRMSLGVENSKRNIVFGCGRRNGGTFSGMETGIVGLNAGEFSLLSQWNITKFAYCLVPFDFVGKDSVLILGDHHATLKPDRGVVTTPLFKQTISYLVTMEAIFVENTKLNVPNVKPGNIWLDSGTTLTFIQQDLYESLVSSVKSLVKLPRARDPRGGFDVCFQTNHLINNVGFPSITLQFSGAKLSLSPHNTFIMVTNNIACFGFLPTKGSNILGNRAQTNFLVSYDLREATVSFSRNRCANL